MAFKSTLLSCLIQIQYEDTIDTLKDLVNSGLPILLPDNTALRQMVVSDPRQITKKISNNSIDFQFNGTVPYKVLNM